MLVFMLAFITALASIMTEMVGGVVHFVEHVVDGSRQDVVGGIHKEGES